MKTEILVADDFELVQGLIDGVSVINVYYYKLKYKPNVRVSCLSCLPEDYKESLVYIDLFEKCIKKAEELRNELYNKQKN